MLAFLEFSSLLPVFLCLGVEKEAWWEKGDKEAQKENVGTSLINSLLGLRQRVSASVSLRLTRC